MKHSLSLALLFSVLLVSNANALIMGMPWKNEFKITSVGDSKSPELEFEYVGPDCEYMISETIPGMFDYAGNSLIPTQIISLARLEGTKPRTKPTLAVSFFPKDNCNPKPDSGRRLHTFKMKLWEEFFSGVQESVKQEYIKGEFTIDFCYQFIKQGQYDSTIGCFDVSYEQLSNKKVLLSPAIYD